MSVEEAGRLRNMLQAHLNLPLQFLQGGFRCNALGTFWHRVIVANADEGEKLKQINVGNDVVGFSGMAMG